jgi:hypothetical protein
MLADTASRSWVCLPGSMFAGSMWPNERVLGSRTSTASGGCPSAGSGGTKVVSPPYRCRGCGASMSAQRAITALRFDQACGTPTDSTP